MLMLAPLRYVDEIGADEIDVERSREVSLSTLVVNQVRVVILTGIHCYQGQEVLRSRSQNLATLQKCFQHRSFGLALQNQLHFIAVSVINWRWS